MKLIPNENTWVGFSATVPPVLASPTAAALTAAREVTLNLISLTATATGNTVPTPSLKSLFETSVPGTSTAQFSADFYRDPPADLDWVAFPRGTVGVFFIARFGGTGTGKKPIVGDKLEVWPVVVTTRAAGPLTNNTAQMFSVTCSVPQQPAEDATVAA